MRACLFDVVCCRLLMCVVVDVALVLAFVVGVCHWFVLLLLVVLLLPFVWLCVVVVVVV